MNKYYQKLLFYMTFQTCNVLRGQNLITIQLVSRLINIYLFPLSLFDDMF